MRGKKRVLVIEDEKSIARAIELKLAHEGFVVDTAHDGDAALAFIETTAYDAILLDLVMPKRDGFSVLEELKKKGSRVPVIVLTNLGQKEDQVRVKALGATDYFIKSNTLIAKVVNRVKELV